MITKEMILVGISTGVVKLIDSPNDGEPACQIGENWFYYAGSEGAGLSSEEYTASVPLDDIAGEIVRALEGIRDDLDGADEYSYYEAVLNEAGIMLINTIKALLPPIIEIINTVLPALIHSNLALAECVRQHPPRPEVQVIITVAKNKDGVVGGAAMLGSDGVWYWTYNGEKTGKVPYDVIGWKYIDKVEGK